MHRLRALAILLVLVVSAQSLFDRCLLICHETESGSEAHCHDSGEEAGGLRLVDASACSHGHDQSWMATADPGAQGKASISSGVPAVVARIAAPPVAARMVPAAALPFVASLASSFAPLRI